MLSGLLGVRTATAKQAVITAIDLLGSTSCVLLFQFSHSFASEMTLVGLRLKFFVRMQVRQSSEPVPMELLFR